MMDSRQKGTAIALSTLVAFSMFFSISCGNKGGENLQAGDSIEISMEDFQQKYSADPSIQILDVRTPAEYSQYHIASGKLVPLQDIVEKGESVSSEIPFAKTSTIYVICASGNRSRSATRMLRQMGYSQSFSVQGGHHAWRALGYACGSKEVNCSM